MSNERLHQGVPRGPTGVPDGRSQLLGGRGRQGRAADLRDHRQASLRRPRHAHQQGPLRTHRARGRELVRRIRRPPGADSPQAGLRPPDPHEDATTASSPSSTRASTRSSTARSFSNIFPAARAPRACRRYGGFWGRSSRMMGGSSRWTARPVTSSGMWKCTTGSSPIASGDAPWASNRGDDVRVDSQRIRFAGHLLMLYTLLSYFLTAALCTGSCPPRAAHHPRDRC